MRYKLASRPKEQYLESCPLWIKWARDEIKRERPDLVIPRLGLAIECLLRFYERS